MAEKALHLQTERRNVSKASLSQVEIAKPYFSPDTGIGLLSSEPGAIPEAEVRLPEAPPSRSSQDLYVLLLTLFGKA